MLLFFFVQSELWPYAIAIWMCINAIIATQGPRPKSLVCCVVRVCCIRISLDGVITEECRYTGVDNPRTRKVGYKTTHNFITLMHDSIVGRNGAKTRARFMESGVTGSSGSFSNGLGANPVQPSSSAFSYPFNLPASRPSPGISSLQRITTFQRNPTDWYGHVRRTQGPARWV